MLKMAVVGPESSGKTTLCEALAMRYGTIWVREAARTYLVALGRSYEEHDLLHMARLQRESEMNAEGVLKDGPSSLILCDTDMITIRIWSQEKFGHIHPELERLVNETRYDHWLLVRPDIPWEPDPLRENPDDRERLFEVYEHTLRDLGRPYSTVIGTHEERMHQAMVAIDGLMERLGSRAHPV